MRIVADENIPLLEPFFADIGEIRRVNGRQMTADDVRDADLLLVRSVTPVNEALLAGSRVRFVGTATIGTDHIDRVWLDGAGIRFSAAPGCNANSVVEYVVSTLSLYAERRGLTDWTDLSVGIVGAGNVGGRLGDTLTRLGFTVRLCDPPRAAREPDRAASFAALEDVLACDVVTLHTPLVRDGDHPTLKLLDAKALDGLHGGQLLINAGRGEVIDGEALGQRLAAPNPPLVALDVWEQEPRICPALVEQVWQATPHIAGYSLEGKVQGTEMIYQAACRFLGLPVRKQAGQFLPEPALSKLCFTGSADAPGALWTALRACYDPRQDDARLRRAMAGDTPDARGLAFDRLRKHYPIRREWSSVKIQLKGSSRALQDDFRALGFKLKT